MRLTGIISALVFARVALGQDSSSTTSAAPTPSSSTAASSDWTPPNIAASDLVESYSSDSDSDPFIPTTISAGCSAFLTSLNSDGTIGSCLASLNTALSSFTSGPGSASAVPKTLKSLCSIKSCTAETIGAKLTEFKDQCSDELIGSNPNPVVIKNYDALYALVPFKAAVCAMDGPNYCLINAGTNSTSTQSTAARRFGRSYVAGHSAAKRAQTVLVPNTNTYSSNYLMFLFTSPAMPVELLCTSCTTNILSKYVSFQTSHPHALGSAKSPLLGSQGTLWSSIGEKCSADYMQKLSEGSSVDNSSSGAVYTAAGYSTALAAALAAAVALF